MSYVVKYRLEGHSCEKTDGPYKTFEIAHLHADGIRELEGVEYARVEPSEAQEVVE